MIQPEKHSVVIAGKSYDLKIDTEAIILFEKWTKKSFLQAMSQPGATEVAALIAAMVRPALKLTPARLVKEMTDAEFWDAYSEAAKCLFDYFDKYTPIPPVRLASVTAMNPKK